MSEHSEAPSKHLAIVGSGAIACGLAATAAHHGPVQLLARSASSAERARVTVERDRSQFDWRFFFAQIRDHHALTGSGSRCALEVIEPAEADHSIDL